jgi:HSP20 family protein
MVPTAHHKECPVYPGGYIPLPETEALLLRPFIPRDGLFVKPLVNMDELEDCYRLEVAMPGVKRENLLILAHDNILTITGLQKNRDACCSRNKALHEFDPCRFERHILLPDDAGTEFVSAEFRVGVLILFISKKPSYLANPSRQIMVY